MKIRLNTGVMVKCIFCPDRFDNQLDLSIHLENNHYRSSFDRLAELIIKEEGGGEWVLFREEKEA